MTGLPSDTQTELPQFYELFLPIVEVLKQNGGSASIHELDEDISEQLQLPDVERERLHGDGPRTELQYRAAWARTYLKKAGALDNSERGVWTLTPKGREMAPEEIEQVHRLVRAQQHEERRRREDELSEAGPETSDWREELLDVLLQMPSDGFERLCQRILRESGFTTVEVSGRSGDGGIDGTGVLRVNLLSFHVLFQCKRWKGTVGAGVVRDFRGAMVGRADKGLIMTTGTFSSEARREATRDGAPAIDLVDGEGICELLKSLRIGLSVQMVEEIAVNGAVFADI